ncbi:MAG: hypothetical protein QXT26_07185 [Thermoproteota archaeon]
MGVDGLELLASKPGAEVVEMLLSRIIREMYIKDEAVIAVTQTCIHTGRGI